MFTLEDLKKRIESTEDLQSVVKTMKALAAVNIRQYERAVESLQDYNRAVEMGLQVALQNRPGSPIRARRAPKSRLGAIIFGSDQGMCGPLNDQVVSYAIRTMDELGIQERLILAIGERVKGQLEDSGHPVTDDLSVPSSVTGITPHVQDLLVAIERWEAEKELNQVFLFYSLHQTGASYRPHHVHLLPVDETWLRRLRVKSWPTRILPTYTLDWDTLFSALIREYLFISLFRAFAESLASENASRLASMQAAEKNIEEQLAELKKQFHQMRQMGITEELLDIVSGFEALTSKKRTLSPTQTK
jgi:F-type H+-transporting ATPase subunit gamma